MIITQKKPIEEVMALVGDAKTVAILGCGSCATACQTGGEAQVAELKKALEAAGKTVVGTAIADYCCMSLGVKAKMKPLVAANPDCVVTMSCGDGVQCAAKHAPGIPVYPSNDTMFLAKLLASAFGKRLATSAASACWAPPALSAPSASALRAWSMVPAAARRTASARSTPRTIAPGSRSITVCWRPTSWRS